MAEIEWTKGPWRVFICDDGKEWTGWPLSIEAVNERDKTVVRTGGQWPYKWDAATSQREAVANAHLIAAAPELAEAMDGIVHFADALSYRDDPLSIALRQWIEAGSAALSKARGES